MIRVFQPADTTFTSNGDVVLRPLRAKVHKEDNNDFYLDIETSTEFADYLVRATPLLLPLLRVTSHSGSIMSHTQETRSHSELGMCSMTVKM